MSQEEAQRRRERVSEVQPDGSLRVAPMEKAAEGWMPVQERKNQRCSWKDRHVRQKGAAQLREIANAQISGRTLQVRSYEERFYRPMEINQEARAIVGRYGRVITMEKEKEKRDHRRADEEMEHASRALRANMMRDAKDRRGRKSGRTQIKELEKSSALAVMDKAKKDSSKMIEALQVCCGGATQMVQSLQEEGTKVSAAAYRVNKLYQELAFRRQYVLPVCQSRGLRRRDLVDSVDRMAEELKALIPGVQRDAEVFMERARQHVIAWNDQNPGKVSVEKIREYLPDYKAETEIVDIEAEEQEEIVDLEEEERKLDAQDGGQNDR